MNKERSKYRGVTYHRKANKYQVSIAYNGKSEYLGLYETELEAHNVYQKRYDQIKHLITSKVNNTNHYVDEKDLRSEMLVSLAMGQLTRKMTEMIVLIAKRTQLKFRYKSSDDKHDCYIYALENTLRNWHNYDADRYDGVLAYLTEICKRGYAFHWNSIYKHMNHISIENTFENGRVLNI